MGSSGVENTISQILAASAGAGIFLAFIVEVLKRVFKIRSQWVLVTAFTLGQVLALFTWGALTYESVRIAYAIFMAGLTLFLGAVGANKLMANEGANHVADPTRPDAGRLSERSRPRDR